MRTLILGGTGHIGAAVVHEALARGHEVSVGSRREAQPRSLAGLAVARLRVDLEGQRAALGRAVEGHSLVVDAAAPYPLTRSSGPVEALVERAVARTRALIRATAEAGATLAHVGSFVTLAGPRRPASRAIRAAHPYFAVKQAMQDELVRAAATGLRIVIVNPSACLGPWDPKPSELAIIPLLLAEALPATVAAPIDVIDVRDVARGLLGAVERERFGAPILLSGHSLGADALARRVCALAGVRPPAIRAPLRPTVLAAIWSDAAWALSVLLIHESGAVEPGVIERELGISPRPLDETLRDAIAWYQQFV